MDEAFRDMLQEVVAHMDDAKHEDAEWCAHLEKTDEVLCHLKEAGFTVNLTKCEWAAKETDFLGHWLTPHGPRPWKKRVEPIWATEEPKTSTELRSSTGMINFHRQMHRKQAHVLAPLTSLLSVTPKAF